MKTTKIPVLLPGLNKMIASAKQGTKKRQPYAATKRVLSREIAPFVRKLRGVTPPVHVHFTYFVCHRRHDLDNLDAGARKIILDVMVDTGVIPKDNMMIVKKLSATFCTCKKGEEGIEIFVTTYQSPGETAKDIWDNTSNIYLEQPIGVM